MGCDEEGLRALRSMNSELLKYPVLKDIKRLERDEIAARVSAFQTKVVLLDVGCGLGEDAHALKDRIEGKIVGIDNNPLAIGNCEPHPSLSFFMMDARDLWLASASFDISYLTVNTLGNVGLAERHTWLKEMLRVSRLSLVFLYLNSGNPERMGVTERLAYYRELVAPDVIFDGRLFRSESRDWAGRLFTAEEIEEMFRVYGIRSYEIKKLNEILLSVAIPAQDLLPEPDLSQVRLLSWDRSE